MEPGNATALAGLANALVQRAMRWPTDAADTGGEHRNHGEALASGRLARPDAQRHIRRALGLAQEALRRAPGDADCHKALGLVLSADGQMGAALATYQTALEIDPEAWGVLINKGDVLEISGRAREAVPKGTRYSVSRALVPQRPVDLAARSGRDKSPCPAGRRRGGRTALRRFISRDRRIRGLRERGRGRAELNRILTNCRFPATVYP